MKLTDEVIKRIARESMEGKTCIECEGKYFHDATCKRGFGLTKEELVRRLQVRADEILSRPQVKPIICNCGVLAEGTFWIGYHNLVAILSVNPVCISCSERLSLSEDIGNRPHGFLPNYITTSQMDVHDKLDELRGLYA